jgi:hypothetical protein
MRALLLKNHVTPTYARAAVAQEATPRIKVFGGIALNAQVGGINPDAVDVAVKMGARCVWMPTVSSAQHIRHFKTKDAPVPVFDDGDMPVAGLIDIVEMIARADIILATGHLPPQECKRLLKLARQAGVKKFVVTHPEFEANAMPVDIQKELAAHGAMFERCFYAVNSGQNLPVEVIAEQINTVGWQSTVLSSDFGQHYNIPPVKGLALFLSELARCGLDEKHLRTMVTEHPASLLNL